MIRSLACAQGSRGLYWPLLISLGVHGAGLYALTGLPLHGSRTTAAQPLLRKGHAASGAAIRIRLESRVRRDPVTIPPHITAPVLAAPPRLEREEFVTEAAMGRTSFAYAFRLPALDARLDDPAVRFRPHDVSAPAIGVTEALESAVQRTVDEAASALARDRVPVPIATTSEGGVDRGIDVIDLPSPRYPTLSVRRGEEGLVLLRVVVGPDGRVLSVEVLRDPGFGLLREAAEDAVRRATFRPALRNGHPVRSTIEIPIRFDLR